MPTKSSTCSRWRSATGFGHRISPKLRSPIRQAARNYRRWCRPSAAVSAPGSAVVFLIVANRGRQGDQNLVHPAPVHVHDFEPAALTDEMLARARQMTQFRQDEARERVEVAFAAQAAQAQPVLDLVD